MDALDLRRLLAVAVLCASAVILVLSVQLSQRLRALQDAPTDSLQWNVTQLELDAVLLENEILSTTAAAAAPLHNLRRRFDLLYSRAVSVERGTMLDRLELSDTAQPLIDRLRQYLSRNITLIDDDDDLLRAGLDRLQGETAILRSDLRRMAIAVIEANAAYQDARRADLTLALRKTAAAGTVLVLLLVSLLALVHRLNRQATDRAQEILRITNLHQATVGTSLDAIIAVDDVGRVIEFNPAAERMFGYPREVAIGRSLSSLIIPEAHIAGHEAGMRRMREGGTPRIANQRRVELTARTRSGAQFPVEMSVAIAEGPEGQVFIGVLRDISEARAVQSVLIDARDKATAADRTKSDFIAVMSHEMRTPLNGMMAALDIIGRSSLDSRQQRFLSIAQDASRQLLRHVNDVLELSRIEAGAAPILTEAIDIEALLATLVEPQRVRAAEKDTKIRLDLPAPLPALRGDPFRLGQILLNLVSNAIKFTDAGQITVSATAKINSADTFMVELSVRDTGIGIDPKDQERIFDDFVMVDPSFGRMVGGTGLGLAISRRLARAMGGDITVSSVKGEGSTFTLRLPMTRAEEAKPEPDTASARAPMTDRPLSVLVVEDNPTNRMVLEELILTLGHSVDLASDGAEGVAKARARKYDLVLMDLSMPRIDGWTATALIREDGASQDSRILAVTAHIMTRDDPRFPSSGFDGLLTKPLSMDDLTKALLGSDFKASPAAPAEPTLPPILDDARLRDLSRLGDGTLRNMLTQAQQDLDRCITAARDTTADPKTRAAHLHEAAGVAALIGATRLHRMLQQGEQACNDADRHAMDTIFGALPEVWTQTRQSLATKE